MAKRRNMALLLLSYTIYTDTTYSIASVTGQLYVAEVRPGTLEYSLYALAQCISGVICSVFFLTVRPYIPIKLETWMLIGYGINLIIPIWGCIGFANVSIGFRVSQDCSFTGPPSGACSQTLNFNRRDGSSLWRPS